MPSSDTVQETVPAPRSSFPDMAMLLCLACCVRRLTLMQHPADYRWVLLDEPEQE
jgi:hypothetical protein